MRTSSAMSMSTVHGGESDSGDPAPALRPPAAAELATALALGDYGRAAAVECSAALRVEIVQAERASGRQEPDFASRAMTCMAIALAQRGNLHDAIAMLNAEVRTAKELSEQLSGQGCNPSERAVLEQCLVGPDREETYDSNKETVRDELFDLFGVWIGLSLMPACLHFLRSVNGSAPSVRPCAHMVAKRAWRLRWAPTRARVSRCVCASTLMRRVGTHRIYPARPRTPRKRITKRAEKEKEKELGDGARHACTRVRGRPA